MLKPPVGLTSPSATLKKGPAPIPPLEEAPTLVTQRPSRPRKEPTPPQGQSADKKTSSPGVAARTTLLDTVGAIPSQRPRPNQLGLSNKPTPASIPETSQQWKIRTPVGLVYDFPDIGSLKNWLSGRESIFGMTATCDGGTTWKPIGDYSELRDALSASAYANSIPKITGEEDVTIVMQPRPQSPPAPRLPKQQAKPGLSGPSALGAFPQGPPPKPLAAKEGMSDIEFPNLVGPKPSQSPPKFGEQPAGPGIPSSESTFPSGDRRPPTLKSSTDSDLDVSVVPALAAPGKRPASGGRRTTGTQRKQLPTRPYRSAGGSRHPHERVGRGTYVGLVVSFGIIVVLVLQVAGVFDIRSWLGFGGTDGDVVYQPGPLEPTASQGEPTALTDQTDDSNEPLARDEYSETLDPRERAIEYLRQRREGINPHQRQIDALRAQADAAVGEGRYSDAISILTNAIQLDRTNTDLVCMLADLHGRAGSYESAELFRQDCIDLTYAFSDSPSE